MTIQLLIFGPLTDLIPEQTLSLDDAIQSNELIAQLCKRYPTLGEKRFVLSVNKKIIHQSVALQDGDEVALLPPFSGG